MNNPYEVLGIKESASEDEIKAAYREQVKKYHPDQYSNNPLADLAEEKLRELNEAYEQLTKGNGSVNGKGYQSAGNGYGTNSYNGGNPGSIFNDIRVLIDRGDLVSAEQKLNSRNDRSAEWFYLMGMVYLKKGWYNQAVTHIQTAVSMEPGNLEYRTALSRMGMGGGAYRQSAQGRGYGQGPDMCTMCQCMWCTDCCCECTGGDLIGCC